MKQYKTTVGEDVPTQFFQKVSEGLKEIRFAAAPELAIKPKTQQIPVQTEELYIFIASEVSINESTPGTLSRKKKKQQRIITVLSARFVMEEKWMTNMARFGSTVVRKITNIGFIYIVLAFHAMMKIKKNLASW